METNAKLSKCRKYRYALWRTWDSKKKKVLFIGLNPSTADEIQNDHTIGRCMSYARQWGYGGIIVGNLFAFRTPSPNILKSCKDPIGPENDKWLKRLGREADIVVAMWGNHGEFLDRADAVAHLFPGLMCLRITKAGQPHHTRGLPDGLEPIRFEE